MSALKGLQGKDASLWEEASRLLKEELASHRDEMQSVTSTLARGLKESRSAAAGGRAAPFRAEDRCFPM